MGLCLLGHLLHVHAIKLMPAALFVLPVAGAWPVRRRDIWSTEAEQWHAALLAGQVEAVPARDHHFSTEAA